MKTYCPVRPREQVDVGLHVLGGERDEVDDDVELAAADRRPRPTPVADVGAQHRRRSPGSGPRALCAAVEDGHLDARADRQRARRPS